MESSSFKVAGIHSNARSSGSDGAKRTANNFWKTGLAYLIIGDRVRNISHHDVTVLDGPKNTRHSEALVEVFHECIQQVAKLLRSAWRLGLLKPGAWSL